MPEKLKLDLSLVLPDVADGGICMRGHGWQDDGMRKMTFYSQHCIAPHPTGIYSSRRHAS